MQTRTRATPFLVLGAFGLLGLGAVILSLATAPDDATTQLRGAAANTAGASSFVLTLTEEAGTTSNPSKGRQQAVIVYQAPDRVRETVTQGSETGTTVLVVGTHSYRRSGNTKWVDLGIPPSSAAGGESEGMLVSSTILFPMQSLSSSDDVQAHHGLYTFVPGQPAVLLPKLLGTNPPPQDHVQYVATVNGNHVGREKVIVSARGQVVSVELALSHVDTAPALQAPPASQVTNIPG